MMLAAWQQNTITVFVQDDSVRDYEILSSGERVRVIRFNSNRDDLAASLGYTARLSYAFAEMARLIINLEGRPDVIEAQDYLGIAYYLLQFKHLLYKEFTGIPVVLTLHSPAFLYLEFNRVATFAFPDFWTCEMEKQAIRMADHLVSPTHFMAETVKAYVAPGESVSVIRNPYAARSKASFAPQRNKLVYYGKLSPQKGSFELLAYFKELWDNQFPHPLYIIGGTDIVYHPEMETMGQLISKKYERYISAGQLILGNKIPPSSLESELKSAHVIILPSIVDNLPYVVIEAMALGKIVLASRQGGQREMITEGVDGYLFDHDLPGDLENKLKLALALSDEQIAEMGRAAQQKVQEYYSPELIGSLKLRLLEELKERVSQQKTFPFLHQENYDLPSSDTVTISSRLSVVIPYYNMGSYISETVSSVKRSVYPDVEILIVDDGSTEPESIRMLEQMANLEGVTVYHKKNEGLADTRNFGAARASGEFLAFLDADDKVHPDYYKKAIQVLQEYGNVFFTGSWVSYFGDSARKWVTFTPAPPYILVHNPLNTSGLVYKRSAFLKGGLNDRKVDYGLEDYESLVNMMVHGYNGVALPEFLFDYRIRRDSMFRKITREKLLYSYKYIAHKHSAYYAKFAAETVSLLNANGPGFLFDNPTFRVTVSSSPERHNLIMSYIRNFIKKNRVLKFAALKLIKYLNK